MPPRKTAVLDPDPNYAPGPIRASTDPVHSAVTSFTDRHPEYAKLGPDAIVQAMSTYRTEEEAAERDKLDGEGVPLGWRSDPDDDDVLESLGRF